MIKPSLLMQKPKQVRDLIFMCSFNNTDHDCLGAYYYNYGLIELQLDTIARHSKKRRFFVKVFDEDKIIERLYFTLTHELIHHTLHKLKCPHRNHHFVTDEVEYINGGGDYD